MENLTLEQIRKIIPIRKKTSHKGTYGKALIVGSSHRYTGAGCICASACVRCGSGLVTLAVEKDIFPIISQKLNEVMVLDIDSYKDDFENLVATCDVIAVGCGLGIRDYTKEKIKYILDNSTSPVVIDADGLNILSQNPNFLKERKNRSTIVLTPHLGEFARLCESTVEEVAKNREEMSAEFVKKYTDVILVLKSDTTLITDSHKSFLCDVGVPQMATGGMGDALCGMIASFIGQGISPLDSCKLGVFTHGYIARKLSENMYCVLAGDVINKIPHTLADFSKTDTKLR